MRKVTFQVFTSTPLPVGEQVFITGNTPTLGNWRADGIPLNRAKDNLWTQTVFLPQKDTIEYKITRGTWETEQVDAEQKVPSNSVLKPGADLVITCYVHRWKDARIPPPPKIVGSYCVHENIVSDYLRWPRNATVWLPPSYSGNHRRQYPVLYMHDGQHVFSQPGIDAADCWYLDKCCTELITEGKMPEIIVVAINSTDDRLTEYDPSQIGQDYGRFLIEELKPFIDREYRTMPGRRTTAIAGSSLGANISFYLAWTRPDIFSGAACLSPAFRLRSNEFDLDLVRGTLLPPEIRLFFYCGGGDDLERAILPSTREMAALLYQKGFQDGKNFCMAENPTGEHKASDWTKTSAQWLTFLFNTPISRKK